RRRFAPRGEPGGSGAAAARARLLVALPDLRRAARPAGADPGRDPGPVRRRRARSRAGADRGGGARGDPALAMRRLAAVVLNWNGIEDTVGLLRSLERCRVPDGWSAQVLVVDNGSTDGSVERLRREFPEVEMLALPENRRFAGGNNAGLAAALAAGADAVMLLNNDTVADPGLLEHLIVALEREPAAGAAAPLIYFAPPSHIIWYAGGRCVPALAHASHRGLRKRDRGQYRKIERTGYLTGCCL